LCVSDCLSRRLKLQACCTSAVCLPYNCMFKQITCYSVLHFPL
jgi:hypothetical protein